MSLIFQYSAVILLATLAGGFYPIFRKHSEVAQRRFVSFGAGVLLAATFVHLIPDTFELLAPKFGGLFILLGFLITFVLERFIMVHPCEEFHCDYHSISITTFLGLSIHSLVSGLALGASLHIDGLGFLLFIALLSHQIPEAFAVSVLLKMGGFDKKKVMIYLSIFALMIPFGATLSFLFLKDIPPRTTGILLALAAGTFLNVSASDLLPEVHRTREHRTGNLISFFIGIILILLLGFIFRDGGFH